MGTMFQKIKQKTINWFVKGLIETFQTGKLNLRTKLVAYEIHRRINQMQNHSWKTTVCGLLGAIGTYLQTVKDPAWLSTLGQILIAVGVGGIGLFGRDDNKSSEQVGAGVVNPNTGKQV